MRENKMCVTLTTFSIKLGCDSHTKFRIAYINFLLLLLLYLLLCTAHSYNTYYLSK